MPSPNKVDFLESQQALPRDAHFVRPVAPEEIIEISIYLRPRTDVHSDERTGIDRRESLHARRSVQHADDVRLLREFAAENGLEVIDVQLGRRLIKLSGTATKIQAVFEITLSVYNDGRREFRGQTGALRLPEDVHAVVESVLGLDNREAAQPQFVNLNQDVRPEEVVAHLPNQIGRLYGFPSNVSGAGQCIGIIELGGGFRAADNAAAFAAMGLSVPVVVPVSVDRGQNAPGNPADDEVALDIQVAGGNAPNARLAVYFAPNTFQGFVDAVSSAVHDSANRPTSISISWGSTETNWSPQAIQTMNTVFQVAGRLDVSVFVASGDNLATDGVNDRRVHVQFPASSPMAMGCGGTLLNTTGVAINSEVVWNDSPRRNTGTGGDQRPFSCTCVPAEFSSPGKCKRWSSRAWGS
jgi:kumamolisin